MDLEVLIGMIDRLPLPHEMSDEERRAVVSDGRG
jgi:hypothetical protein